MAEPEIERGGVDSSERFDLPQVLAELAAKEWEALEVIKGDLCQWLGEALQLHITPSGFLDALGNGVQLCRLVGLIQQAARKAGQEGTTLSIKVPLEPLNCSPKAAKGSFFARDNVSNFISWCRELGVEEAVIFESDGLVLHRDEKRVILCLLDVARFAEKVGISPPQLVRMEREIEMLETLGEVHHDDPLPNETATSLPTETGGQPTALEKTELETSTPAGLSEKPHPSGVTFKASRIPVRRSLRNKTASRALPVRSVSYKPRKRTRSTGEEKAGQSTHPQKRNRTGDGGGKKGVVAEAKRQGAAREEAERLKESVDESVMRKMAECTCQNKIEVTNCGRGKFLVRGASGRRMTIYARVSV